MKLFWDLMNGTIRGWFFSTVIAVLVRERQPRMNHTKRNN